MTEEKAVELLKKMEEKHTWMEGTPYPLPVHQNADRLLVRFLRSQGFHKLANEFIRMTDELFWYD